MQWYMFTFCMPDGTWRDEKFFAKSELAAWAKADKFAHEIGAMDYERV